jgi:hypothetical protein
MSQDQQKIAAEILRLTDGRGPTASICPSEVARSLSENWRPLLGAVRREAALLAEAGDIEILRKGRPVPPADVRGVIRLRRRRPEAG